MNPLFNQVLSSSAEDQRDLFVTSARRLGTNERNLEKDFWVCWTLDALFHELPAAGTVHAMLTACVMHKMPEDHVFTRSNGKPVLSFRGTWERECTRAGVGKLVCAHCGATATDTAKCSECGYKGTRYAGLIFHDLRRTAARNLRRAGIGETVIMKIGGWRTRSVFERYAIVSRNDIADAMRKLQDSEVEASKSIAVVPAAVSRASIN